MAKFVASLATLGLCDGRYQYMLFKKWKHFLAEYDENLLEKYFEDPDSISVEFLPG